MFSLTLKKGNHVFLGAGEGEPLRPDEKNGLLIFSPGCLRVLLRQLTLLGRRAYNLTAKTPFLKIIKEKGKGERLPPALPLAALAVGAPPPFASRFTRGRRHFRPAPARPYLAAAAGGGAERPEGGGGGAEEEAAGGRRGRGWDGQEAAAAKQQHRGQPAADDCGGGHGQAGREPGGLRLHYPGGAGSAGREPGPARWREGRGGGAA